MGIQIEGENSGDWIALCAASVISWARRVDSLVAAYGHPPAWARLPPVAGSVLYVPDEGRDTWTFGEGGQTEYATFHSVRGDCDTLMSAGAGARLALGGFARIATVANGRRGHTFETSWAAGSRGHKLIDMSVYGGMRPLETSEYNMRGNIALLEREHSPGNRGPYRVTIVYDAPANVAV